MTLNKNIVEHWSVEHKVSADWSVSVTVPDGDGCGCRRPVCDTVWNQAVVLLRTVLKKTAPRGLLQEKKMFKEKYDRNEMKSNEAGNPSPEIRATLTLESYHSSVIFDQAAKTGQFTATLFIRWIVSLAPALVLPSCIFRCAWTVCTAQAIRKEHGAFCASLSPP